MIIDMGVIHGRFQVLHLDHLKYLLAGKALCRHLVVAVTNPDPTLVKDDETDPQRSDPLANPLTYFERYVLVRAVLAEAGIPLEEFSVVPLPINFPELYRYYVPLEAVFFLTIYDDWGRRKLSQFQGLGLKTRILWERPIQEKGITGQEVRRRMIEGAHWEELLPPASAALMKDWNIPQRLAFFY